MDLVILVLITSLVLLLCDKNNSPDFLTKILYNSEFVDKPREEGVDSNATKNNEDCVNSSEENPSNDNDNSGKSSKNVSRSKKKKKDKRKASLDFDDEATSNLDYSTDEELVNFDATSVADELLKAINEG